MVARLSGGEDHRGAQQSLPGTAAGGAQPAGGEQGADTMSEPGSKAAEPVSDPRRGSEGTARSGWRRLQTAGDEAQPAESAQGPEDSVEGENGEADPGEVRSGGHAPAGAGGAASGLSDGGPDTVEGATDDGDGQQLTKGRRKGPPQPGAPPRTLVSRATGVPVARPWPSAPISNVLKGGQSLPCSAALAVRDRRPTDRANRYALQMHGRRMRILGSSWRRCRSCLGMRCCPGCPSRPEAPCSFDDEPQCCAAYDVTSCGRGSLRCQS